MTRVGRSVCIVSSCFDPENLGGVGVLVDAERRGLERLGYDVHVVGVGRGRPGETGATRIAGPKKIFPWAAALAYLRAHRGRRFDLVHGHEFSGTYVALAARIQRLITGRGPAIVTTMQCSFLRESRTTRPFRDRPLTLRERIDKYIDFPFRFLEGVVAARLSDCTVAVSQASAREIARDYLGGRDGLPVVPNGVDTDRFHPGVDGEPFRREAGLGSDPVVLFAGRFVARKGVEHLLDAFARVAPRHPRARLVILGRGRRDYAPLARDLGIRDRTHILPGLPHDRMPAAHAAADIFCLPSIQEGLPLALLEAMASGKAVVSTRTDGIPEAVRHDVSGLLVPPGSATDLAGAIDRLLDDAALRRRLGSEARRTAVDRFSWEGAFEAYGEIFDRVGRRRAGGRR